MHRFCVLAITLALSIPAAAASSAPHYQCRIQAVYGLNADGTLMRNDEHALTGTGFAVDRESGMVVGKGLNNAAANTRAVLDYGDTNHAFKLVWLNRLNVGRSRFESLVIRDPNHDSEKPFIAQASWGTATGVCR